MAVQVFSDVQWSADKRYFIGTVASATAADTVTVAPYLEGRTIAGVYGANTTDAVNLAYTYTAAGVVTVPAGPSTDALTVIVFLI